MMALSRSLYLGTNELPPFTNHRYMRIVRLGRRDVFDGDEFPIRALDSCIVNVLISLLHLHP